MENSTNFTTLDTTVYTSVGVTHILLVVIPSLVLGITVLSLLISNKKLRDPSSIIFICTVILCVLSPSTYGLLMDISLLTDIPVIGICGTLSEFTFWVFFYTSQLQLLAGTAFLSVAQYLTIKWGAKYLSICKTVVIYLILLGVCSLPGLVNIIVSVFSRSEHERGSLCRTTQLATAVAINVLSGIGLVFYLTPSVVIVITFSVLTSRYVKRHTVQNKKVVRNVITIMILTTVFVVIFHLIPVVGFILGEQVHPTSGIDFALAYSTEINFPMFILLTMVIHKTVRETLTRKVQKCVTFGKDGQRHSNQVAPAVNSTNLSAPQD